MRTPVQLLFLPVSALALAVCLSAEPLVASLSFPNIEAKVVLTSRWNGTVPQESFPSEGLIHAYLMFSHPVEGEHLLEGIWMDPSGVTRENARATLRFDPPGGRTAYLWLKLEGSEDDGLTGMFQWREPEPVPRGRWKLEVRMDGRTIARSEFEVR